MVRRAGGGGGGTHAPLARALRRPPARTARPHALLPGGARASLLAGSCGAYAATAAAALRAA